MTGRFLSSVAGVQMFSVRQFSSLCGGGGCGVKGLRG